MRGKRFHLHPGRRHLIAAGIAGAAAPRLCIRAVPSLTVTHAFRAGRRLIVFLEKGSFIFVMASATGEPAAVLFSQLRLVHAQILSILTTSVDKMFVRNPSYDARKLLGKWAHCLTLP